MFDWFILVFSGWHNWLGFYSGIVPSYVTLVTLALWTICGTLAFFAICVFIASATIFLFNFGGVEPALNFIPVVVNADTCQTDHNAQ